MKNKTINYYLQNLKILFLLISIFALFLTKANASSVVTSSDIPVTIDSRIKTIVYNENEVFQLKFHYGFQSFIEFSDDEEIEVISLGEAFPWRITPVGKRLFIRPLQINVKTNMTIITTKRTYQFEISADSYEEKTDEELVFSVRFYYPEKKIRIPSIPEVNADGTPVSELDKKLGEKGFAIERQRGAIINYDYSMAGQSDEFAPIKVFDDGVSTYFQFPNNNLIIPTINAVDIYGNERALNYYIDGDYAVVDTVQLQFSLRLGTGLICIFNHAVM